MPSARCASRHSPSVPTRSRAQALGGAAQREPAPSFFRVSAVQRLGAKLTAARRSMSARRQHSRLGQCSRMTPEPRTLDGRGGANDNGAMTVRVPHLPFSLDPLIAEAKRRMRRRRLLVGVLLLLLAGSAVAAGFALSGSTAAHGSAPVAPVEHDAATASQRPCREKSLVRRRV